MLSGVQIEHEVCQCALQLCTQIPIHSKARSGEFCCPLQIEHSQLLAQFPMWFCLKAELRRSSPTPHLDVVVLAAPPGNARVRQIGDLRHHATQLLFELRCYL